MASKVVRFKGYDFDLDYQLPVPPGTPPSLIHKEKVRIAEDVPPAAVGAVITMAYGLIGTLSTAIAEADPFKGWSPFVAGLTIQSDYEVIEVP